MSLLHVAITIEQALDDGYEDYLDRIDDYLSSKLKDKYTYEGFTKVAIKFSIQPPGERSVDVDLLLSPFFDSHAELLSELTKVQPPLMRTEM